MKNSTVENPTLPRFDEVKAENAQQTVEEIIAENERQIDSLLEKLDRPSWANLAAPIDDLNDGLSKAWSPINHMNAVVNTPELRDAYSKCMPMLSQYYTRLGQSVELYAAFERLAQSPEYANLSIAQQQQIQNSLRDFRLAGVALLGEKKARYGEIKQELAELGTQFSNNVMDATQSWSKHIPEKSDLAGVPDSALAAMQQAAQLKNKEGYLLTLDFPLYLPIITHCENQELREEIYRAFSTRASDQGPHANQWDNSELIDQILKLRHEMAELLGFDNYASLSLATKMADSPQQVMEFLNDLAEKVVPQAKQEFKDLCEFAKSEYGVEELAPWDLSFYSEKLKQAKFSISQEELKPYFPADHVIDGLFEIAQRLFGISVKQADGKQTWHSDVRYFEIYQGNEMIGMFYLDLYARENKRGGAWMSDYCGRRLRTDQSLQLPVSYLTCNFSNPIGDDPALLTHNEVTTLFHEFGHGLHHMLTKIDAMGVSGISGVPWDAVELPSQFLENWCWQPEGIALISKHYKTRETLPTQLLDKTLAAKNFQSAIQTVRQLEFALFDFRLHLEYDAENPVAVNTVINQVRQEVAVTPVSDDNRFQNGFSHIFAGGYAAGYYSYKWAEVLSADAFSRFQEEGIFNSETGQSFLENILEKGGSQPPLNLFVAFRGREPKVEALLRQDGLLA